MKILLLTHNISGLGGSYMRSFALGSALAALGHEVSLIASRSKPGLSMRSTVINNVLHVEMPDLLPLRIRHGGLSPMDTLFRSAWVTTHSFDVIHGFDHRPAVLLPALLGRILRDAIFISDWADLWGLEGISSQRRGFFGRLLGNIDHIVEGRARRWADGVTAISSDLDRRLAGQGVAKNRRMMLPPGSNLVLIEVHDKHQARVDLNLSVDGPIVAFTGFAPYDQEFLSQVVLNLLRKDSRVRVISSGAVIEALDLQVIEVGVAKRLVQFGRLPLHEISSVLGAADVLILPFLDSAINRGRFPNKFGDYLASGRPIVTHRTGDLAQLVEDEQLGILSSEDPEMFADDVLALLNDPVAIDRSGSKGRIFAEQHWSWEIMAKKVDAFYDSILARSG